jgi:beta-glucuronidase
MARLILTHPKRVRLSLDGFWHFLPVTKPTSKPPPARVYREQIAVPGAWESTFAHAHYRGFAWYHRSFEVPGDQSVSLRLVFEAVSHTGKVWFDGRYLGEHRGAHTEFAFTVEQVKPGRHEIAVLVDNTYGPHMPLFYPTQDIQLYGGLTRSVYAEVLPESPLTAVSAIPQKTVRGWVLDVRGVPRSATVALNEAIIGKGPGLHRVGNIELWSPEHPRLYTVRVSTSTDVWQERVGFRTIAVRGRQLLLNGKPLFLQGVNRHEFHPDFGSAVPATVHVRDIEILKKLGANFVRGSHYPNDPLFLDLCDEHGLLFWEELSHWQPRKCDFADPLFLALSLAQADEMVRQHRHHPSIILWGMCNELESEIPAARRVVRSMANRFRKLDPTRPVTFATNRVANDQCLDLVDVISLNIYPGWYVGGLEQTVEMTQRDIQTAVRRGGRKPIILSEFGGAALTGVRSFESRKWTEGYQADLVRRVIVTAQQSGLVSGVAIWQYCDVRTSADLWYGRPREYNNKGIVTMYREPKEAWHAVREQFRQPWKRVKP